MQLIGMLDSPYVRRTAISLRLLGLPFEHRSISVFGGYDVIARINPVVKVPTLVCDDGTVLMDSALIIDHAEHLTGRSLLPTAPHARLRTLRLVGLALAASEKAVALVYEFNLRPPEKQHAPWIDRVRGQCHAAFTELDRELAAAPLSADEPTLTQAGVSAAVAWSFTQLVLPGELADAACPALAAHAQRAEALPVFRSLPQR